MIKTENHLAEKCQGCPCFEAIMHRDDIYTDHTVAVTILSIDILKGERRNNHGTTFYSDFV